MTFEEKFMLQGIICALCACLIWGLIFVVPQFISGFSSIEIALGRYFFYGIISLLIFCKSRAQGFCRYPRHVWIRAAYFSLVITIFYYTFVVLSLRYSTPALTVLVSGISPIAIAFYGNWRQKEISFRRLIVPSLLILIGLVIINIPHLERAVSSFSYSLGLICGFVALLAWSWYVVANSRFLKNHPQVSPSNWATLIGVATLFWVLICTLFLAVFFENQLHLEKYLTWNPELKRLLMGSLTLAILSSWVGGFLWNKASLYLPVSLAGQLTIFETIFSVIFVYSVQRQLPSLSEVSGIVIFLIAIVYGTFQFAKKKSYSDQLSSHIENQTSSN